MDSVALHIRHFLGGRFENQAGVSPLSRLLGEHFHPDEQLKLRDKHWSEGVAKQAVKYSGKLSFGEVSDVLQELGQIEVSAESVWCLA
ncbi:MAG: hypothetical protein ACOYYJ_02480 [Chloroflexota bacterium]